MKLHQPIDQSDYINASWITKGNDLSNNIRPGISLIASQGPTKETCCHHLQMIYENKVDIIVMLTKCTEESGKGNWITSALNYISYCKVSSM